MYSCVLQNACLVGILGFTKEEVKKLHMYPMKYNVNP
jgi:hypothetical protein